MENNKRHDKFIRLSKARKDKIIKTLELLGNLSNKSSYSYSSKEIEEIYNEIRKACQVSKSRYKFKKTKSLVEKQREI